MDNKTAIIQAIVEDGKAYNLVVYGDVKNVLIGCAEVIKAVIEKSNPQDIEKLGDVMKSYINSAIEEALTLKEKGESNGQ